MARYPMTPFTPGSLLGGAGDPFLALHREMNQLFNDVLRGGAMPSAGGQGQGSGTPLLAPQMEASETDNEVRIQAELPGVAEQDIEVSLDEDVLTIRAEKKQERREERQGVHFSERAYGTFQRSLRLPFQVNPDQVRARFENGVLSVTLPKTQPQERSRRIQVQSGSGGSRQQPQIEGEATAAEQQGSQAGGEGSGTQRQQRGGSAAAGSASGGKARRTGRTS